LPSRSTGWSRPSRPPRACFRAARHQPEHCQGEFVLIGHSGCGKSTLLNLIAGLTIPTGGHLLCANKEIKGPGPERAVVFQNHSLLPWLSCWGNVHLAVERVFGKRARPSWRSAPMRRWPWWASAMRRKSALAKSRAA
jgi:ABC-type sugar transport system ATPase subunit